MAVLSQKYPLHHINKKNRFLAATTCVEGNNKTGVLNFLLASSFSRPPARKWDTWHIKECRLG